MLKADLLFIQSELSIQPVLGQEAEDALDSSPIYRSIPLNYLANVQWFST